MESGMIIIAAILVAVIVVPVVLIILNTKTQTKTLSNGLKAISLENKGVVSQHIEHNNFALGADETKKAIYYYKNTEDGIVSKTIDLTTVAHCEVCKISTRIKKEKGYEELTQKIYLSFISRNGEAAQHIHLYDEDDSLLVNGELAIAETWKRIVNQLIDTRTSIVTNEVEFQPTMALS